MFRSLVIKVYKNWTNYPSAEATDAGLRRVDLAKDGQVIPLDDMLEPDAPEQAVSAADNFANAVVIAAGTRYLTSNAGASVEAGEDSMGYGENSIWFRWTAPYSGNFSVSLRNSSFDTFLSVHTGDSVDSLALIGSNDDYYGVQSRVDFAAVSGTEYKIAVRGYSGSEYGDVKLLLYETLDYLKAYCSSPSSTSGDFEPINAFEQHVKTGTSVGTSWKTQTGEFSNINGTPVSGNYVQIVCVFPKIIEADAVIINNYHYVGVTTEKGVSELEIYSVDREVSQAEAEDNITPIADEVLVTTGVVLLPEHVDQNIADDFQIDLVYPSYADQYSCLEFSFSGESDIVSDKAYLGSAIMLGVRFEAADNEPDRLTCALELAASFGAGDVYAPAEITAAIEAAMTAEAVAGKGAILSGSICIGCLMRGISVPAQVMQAAMELSMQADLEPVAAGGMSCALMFGCSMSGAGGHHVCQLPDFKNCGFF